MATDRRWFSNGLEKLPRAPLFGVPAPHFGHCQIGSSDPWHRAAS